MPLPFTMNRYYVFTGRVGEVIPRRVRRVRIAESLKVVPARAIQQHPNIQEIECHDGVEKIEQFAFSNCPSLRRLIMPGVKEVEKSAIYNCTALTHIECGKLEIIGAWAFCNCESLRSIDLPSARIVKEFAFHYCMNLKKVKFGIELESIRSFAFNYCRSLERIALPLKDGLMQRDIDVFRGCIKLNRVDLVERSIVHETIAALLLEEWKNDMSNVIKKRNRELASAHSGPSFYAGGKSQAIRWWIRSVLRKIVEYKAEHRRYLNATTTALQPALPDDIVLKNVLPFLFLELPSYTFEGEN